MNYFVSFVKIAGASFPVSASLVQLVSEIESKDIKERIEKLEDPISFLHPDIRNLSKLLYETIKEKDSDYFELTDEIYEQFRRALACLESKKLIRGYHSVGKNFDAGLSITDPTYILYMCNLFEEHKKMEKLYKLIDECPIDNRLDGKVVKKDIALPLPVIKAAFEIFKAKGYGSCSEEIGSVVYMADV